MLGAAATYASALPGVSLSYTVTNDGLKEWLSLANPAAASSFVYALNLSPGRSAASNAAGGLDVIDASGLVVFSLAAPEAQDSAAASAYLMDVNVTDPPSP